MLSNNPKSGNKKYVSMFRIDGHPILPPLMNIEKRLEMQMYREKAIQLERKFVAEKQQKRVQFPESPRGQLSMGSLKSTESNSSLSSEEEERRSSSEISSPSTPKTGKVHKSYKTRDFNSKCDPTLVDCGTNTLLMSNEGDTKERMRKLSKSKTICFDNSSSSIIRAMTNEEIAYASGQLRESKEIYLCEMVEIVNLDNAEETKKQFHLPLPEYIAETEPKETIPSICVNPPTPLTGPSNLCETLSATESVDSYDASGFQSSQATLSQAVEFTDDSPDKSADAPTLTKPLLLSTRSVARTLKYGRTQNEINDLSPTMQLRIEGGDNSPESCFAMRSPQRSATSPSLKSISDTIATCSLTSSPRGDDTSAHSLIRSSSFTLEAPSKALLEHIRQQNTEKLKGSASSGKLPALSRKTSSRHRLTPSTNAYRETVESKAKRVQKKVETKSSTRASSNARSKPKTTFNQYSTNPSTIWNNPVPPLKVKRSPYDLKGASAATKLQAKVNAHKVQTSTKSPITNVVKKSTSSTTYTIKQSASRASLPNTSMINMHTVSDDAEIMAEIDNRHRQKLLALIAQQQEEQRRLQQAFETQQRMLLDQLNNERHRQSYNISDDNSTPLNANIIFNDIIAPVTAATFDRSSPTLSVTSSYISPGKPGGIGGFTTTTTTTCELPYSVPSTTNNVHSSLQRPLQIMEMPSPVYLNNAICNGTTGDKITLNNENRQLQYPVIQSKDNAVLIKVNAAATTINAYTRGFLVRRLFQTEQIQRIVQTIRDTLIFVLNLHMETMENSEEACTDSNIKLKARLLQQLASASRTLHLILFQTSIQERMEIISRDRKRIKTKLLSMSLKRSPRIV